MRKKLIYGIVIAALLLPVILAACAAPAPPGPEKLTWRIQCAYPPGDISHDQLTVFADRVYERTEGRLKIDIFSADAIVPVDNMLPALGKGVFEMLHASGGYWEGIIPVGALDSGIPFQYRGFGTLENITELFYEAGLIEIFREAYAEHNAYYLGFDSYHAYPVIGSTVPIRSIEDFKGLKVRGFGPWLEFFGKLGASTVWLPGPELYMAVKLGTIDVVTWSIDLIISMKLHEVIDYLILPPLADHAVSHILVNMDSWEALPDDIKQVVTEVQHEYGTLVYSLYDAEWKTVLGMGEALGYEVITLPDADVKEMEQLSLPMWDEFAAKDDYSARAIALLKDFYG